jgi:hypothetical protein
MLFVMGGALHFFTLPKHALFCDKHGQLPQEMSRDMSNGKLSMLIRTNQ